MAWSSPRTWSTSEVVTAAHMNQEVRDNLEAGFPDDVSAVSWSPTLEATTTNPSTSSVAGRYWRVGPVMFVWARWVLSDGGSGIYFVTLPTAASGVTASGNGYGGQAIGSFVFRDDSTVSASVAGAVRLRASDEASFDSGSEGTVNSTSNDAGFGGAATGDVLSMWACYPVA